MFKVISLVVALLFSVGLTAQERIGAGYAAVTSISPQAREIIVGKDIYRIPPRVVVDGVNIPRERLSVMLRPGDMIAVELNADRSVKAVRTRMR